MFTLLFLFQISLLPAQIKISGETNFISKGKAILMLNAPIKFYETLTNNDSTELNENKFSFNVSSSYPLQFRLVVMNDSIRIISEPFFVEAGDQKIKFNKDTEVHSKLDFGYGITLTGSKVNEDYLNKYLPIYDLTDKRMAQLFTLPPLVPTPQLFGTFSTNIFKCYYFLF